MDQGNLRYDAFLSYSTEAEGDFVRRFHRALEQTLCPWLRLRSIRVFRDETGFALTDSLWPAICEKLAASSSFVLMASPGAATSRWVEQEVEWWLTHKPHRQVLIVLTSGEIVWDSRQGQVDRRLTTALPSALVEMLTTEPLYGDARPIQGSHLRRADPRFQVVVARTYAGIKGWQDLQRVLDLERRRRARRLTSAGVLLFALLLAIVGYVLANAEATQQREVAKTRQVRLIAQAQIEAAESRREDRRIPFGETAILAAQGLYTLNTLGELNPRANAIIDHALELSPPGMSIAEFPQGERPTALVATNTGTLVGTDSGRICRVALTPSNCKQASGRVEHLVWNPSAGLISQHTAANETRLCTWSPARSCFSVSGSWAVARKSGRIAWIDARRLCWRSMGQPACGQIHEGPIKALVATRDGVGFQTESELCTSAGPKQERCVRFNALDQRILVGTDGSEGLLIAERGQQLVAYKVGAKLRDLWHVPLTGTVRASIVSGRRLALTYVARRAPNYDVVLNTARYGRPVRLLAHQGIVSALAFSPSGRFLISGGSQYPSDGTASVWLAEDGHEIARGHLTAEAVAVDDVGHASVIDDDGQLHFWGLTGPLRRHVPSKGGTFSALSLDRFGNLRYRSNELDCRASPTVHDCKPASRTEFEVVRSTLGELRRLAAHRFEWAPQMGAAVTVDADTIDDVEASAVAEQAPVFAIGGSVGNYASGRVWVFESGRKRRELKFSARVHAVALSPEGKYVAVATGTERGQLTVWERTTGRLVARRRFEHPVRAMSFGRGGRIWTASGALSQRSVLVRSHVWSNEVLLDAVCRLDVPHEVWQSTGLPLPTDLHCPRPTSSVVDN